MNQSLGRTVRLRRKALGLTQARLAELVGIDQPTVSRLEAGALVPPIQVLERLADVLGLRLTVRLDQGRAAQCG